MRTQPDEDDYFDARRPTCFAR